MHEPEHTKKRVVSLIDMDCFYVQCEQRLSPDTWDTPCAVAQFNNWTGGGMIAVNYQARPFGVKRGMRNVEAKKCCPDLHIFTVPERNGKADLTRYREASGEVFDAITDYINKLEGQLGKRGLIILERASIDEAFIDLSEYISAKPLELPDDNSALESFNTKVIFNGLSLEDWLQSIQEGGSIAESQLRLLIGTHLMGNIRKYIFEKTQFRCSAGISHNKMLAKLACGVNKPNAQTILPLESVSSYFQSIPISDVRSLGGQFGEAIQNSLNIKTMGQLQQIDKDTLVKHFDPETAEWLSCYSQGYDYSKVTKRSLASSIGCSKNFPGHLVLATKADIEHWVNVLCEEAYDRIESDRQLNKRLAQQLVVGHNTSSGQHTKALNINYDGEKYPPPEELAKTIIKAVFDGYDAQANPLSNLSINVTKFEAQSSAENLLTIRNYFSKIDRSASKAANTASSAEPTATTSDAKDEPVIQNTVETDDDQEDNKEVGKEESEKESEELNESEDSLTYDEKDESSFCDCKESEESESSSETEGDLVEKVGQDGTKSDTNEEPTKTSEGMNAYEDLPPERVKQLTKSFFYQKALELYDFDNQIDSDLVDYPDDESEEILEKERKALDTTDDDLDDIDLLLGLDSNFLKNYRSDNDDDEDDGRKKKRARIESDE